MINEIDKIKTDVEEFLKNSEEHKDKEINYILYDSNNYDILVLASNGNDKAIEFNSFNKIDDSSYKYVPNWNFDSDYHIFEYLEDGKQIAYINDEIHYNLWEYINDFYPDEIPYTDGIQKYLEYCKWNNITEEYLSNKGLFVLSDTMRFFNGIGTNETMEYKGYVIEVGDVNDDNPDESLIYIYSSKSAYQNYDYLEIVSLNNIGLKSNICEYIDDYYINNSWIESEKAYFTFVLGYDLLNDMLSKSGTPENDVSYDFCDMIASKFLKSKEYKNEKYSAYEMLESWVDDNKDYIVEQHRQFTIDKNYDTRQLDNGIYVMDLGYRNKQPVALLEKTTEYGKEYIIAFDYKIVENKIDWLYGYYYNNDLEKVQKDFKKVLEGKSLYNTFNKDKEDIER